MKQLLLDIAPSPVPTLNNFVCGHNEELLQLLTTLQHQPLGKRSVYIWGDLGSGRSHLLNAMVSDFQQRGMAGKLARAGDLKTFTEIDLLAIDDVETLDKDEQITLFNLFNAYRESGQFLVVSGTQAPMQLMIRDDLKTRLGWGWVYQLHALDHTEKTEALQCHAVSRGFDLPLEVIDYLLQHVKRDLPSLMGMLDALDEWSLTEKRRITVPLLRQLLKHSE